jgi:hypothetical protein
VDDQPGSDLVAAVDDLRLAAEDFAEDLLEGLRRVAAHRSPHTSLGRRPHLHARDRVEGVHGADVPAVEVGRVVEEEIDLVQLLFLDVDHGVGERVELAGVVPVAVPEHDPGDVAGIQADRRHLKAEVLPAAPRVPVEDIGELLPARIVQRDLAVRSLERLADVLVVRGDPTREIAALWDVLDVYQAGRRVARGV